MEALLERHAQEVAELKESSKALLKGAKKSERAATEARVVQMEFDLKARHRDEVDQLEEELGVDADTVQRDLENSATAHTDSASAALQSQIQAKKAKNQKKKDKRADKEQQRSAAIQDMRAAAGPSQREQELLAINARLLPLNLKVKEVLSDGNCLYRAVADQCRPADKDNLDTNLTVTEDLDLSDFVTMRKLAGAHIRQYPDSFAPFLGFDAADPEFESYCSKIENVSGAEWGGQLEVRALSECLRRPIHIYEATAPVIKMGEETAARVDSSVESSSTTEPIIVTYHRHYYALGEHYNSVSRIIQPSI